MNHLQPVRTQHIPDYPTRQEALTNPILLKTLPKRWQHSGGMVAAAGLLATSTLVFTACQRNTGTPLPLNMISESDAISLIKDRVGGKLGSLQDSYYASISEKQMIYVHYDESGQIMEEVTLLPPQQDNH